MADRKPTTAEERGAWRKWWDGELIVLRFIADVDHYEPIVQAVAKAPCLCRHADEEGRCLGCDAKAALGLPLPDKAHGSKEEDKHE